MKIETDQVRIVSGVRHSQTIGSPIAILIENKDWKNWTGTLPVQSTDAVPGRRNRSSDLVRGTRTSPAPSSTTSRRRATSWSGPVPGKRRLVLLSARSSKSFLRAFGVEILSHVVAVGRSNSSARPPGKRSGVSASGTR